MIFYLINVRGLWREIQELDKVEERIKTEYRVHHVEAWPGKYLSEYYLLGYRDGTDLVEVILTSPIPVIAVTPQTISGVIDEYLLNSRLPSSLMAQTHNPASEWYRYDSKK